MAKSVTSVVSLKALVAAMAERFALSRHNFNMLLSMRYGIGYNPAGNSAQIAEAIDATPFVVRGLLTQAWKKGLGNHHESVADVSRIVGDMVKDKQPLVPLAKVATHPYFEGVLDPETAIQNLVRDMASYADAIGPSFPRIIQVGKDAPVAFIPQRLPSVRKVKDIAPKAFKGYIPGWAIQVATVIRHGHASMDLASDLRLFCREIIKERGTRSCKMLLDRIGIDAEAGMSLEEVGERHNVTRERARISCQDAIREIQMVEAALGWGPLTNFTAAIKKAYPGKLPPLLPVGALLELDYLEGLADNETGLSSLMSAAGFGHLIRTNGFYINSTGLDKAYAIAILRSIESMENAADNKAEAKQRPAIKRMSVTLKIDVINKAHALKKGRSDISAVNTIYAQVISDFLKGKLPDVTRDLEPVEWDRRGEGWHMVHILLPKEDKLEFAKRAHQKKVSRSSLTNALMEEHMEAYWNRIPSQKAA